jgi:hypothetical protein
VQPLETAFDLSRRRKHDFDRTLDLEFERPDCIRVERVGDGNAHDLIASFEQRHAVPSQERLRNGIGKDHLRWPGIRRHERKLQHFGHGLTKLLLAHEPEAQKHDIEALVRLLAGTLGPARSKLVEVSARHQALPQG